MHPDNFLNLFIAWLIVILVILINYMISAMRKFNNYYPFSQTSIKTLNKTILKQFLSSGVMLFPGIIIYNYYLSQNFSIMSLEWSPGFMVVFGCLIALICIINYKLSDHRNVLKYYPLLGIVNWNISNLTVYNIGWLVYLFSYEFIFRGVLLYISLELFDTEWAVVVNLILYLIVHIKGNLSETFLSIPFGALLVFITLQTGSILPAFILHAVLALTFENMIIFKNLKLNCKI